MDNKLELNLTLDNLSDDEREQLMKLVNKAGGESDEDIIWKPESDEDYYVLSSMGKVLQYEWANDDEDNNFYNSGNVFRTKELAENMAARKKRISVFENKMMEFAEGYEWRKAGSNYYLYYNTNSETWNTELMRVSHDPSIIYMDYNQAGKAITWANKFYPEGGVNYEC